MEIYFSYTVSNYCKNSNKEIMALPYVIYIEYVIFNNKIFCAVIRGLIENGNVTSTVLQLRVRRWTQQ